MVEKKKRSQYVVVMDWMYDNFGFNCAEANTLAIIYGFSQDGASWFCGGSAYIAERLHISQKSAKNYLADFVKRGILEMKKEMVGNVPHNAYRTVPNIENLVLTDTPDQGKNFPREKISPGKNFPPDQGKNFPLGREKFSTSNKKRNKSSNKIYLSAAQGGLMDDTPRRDEVESELRQRLEIDTLARRYDPEMLRELLENITAMYTCPHQCQMIGGQLQNTAAIRRQLDKLTSQHIEYIMDSLANTTQPVKNIQAYLRTTILNAPTTMEHYYQAQGNAACAHSGHPAAAPEMPGLESALRRIKSKRSEPQ